MVLAAGMGAPAQAATPGPWQSFSSAFADSHWTLTGKIAGVPGNAHSGQFGFDTSDPNVSGVLLDWNCPAGVTPPYGWNLAIEYNDTSCTILRYREIDWSNGAPADPTFRGTWTATVDGDYLFDSRDPDGGALLGSREGHIRAAFTRTGPVKAATVHTVNSTLESYETTREATSAALHGRIDYLNLQDPRLKVTVEQFSRYDERYRFFTS